MSLGTCPAGHALNGISEYCTRCESIRRKIRRERTRKPTPPPPRQDKHLRTISVYQQTDVVLVLPADCAERLVELFTAALHEPDLPPEIGRAAKLALTGIRVSQAGEDRLIGRHLLPELADATISDIPDE